MNINVFHRINEDDNSLLNAILKTFDMVTHQEVDINTEIIKSIHLKDENSDIERSINSPRSILNCLDRESFRRILNLNHIPLKQSGEAVISLYNILILNRSVISIRHMARNRVNYLKQSQCPKAADIGKKAVYHLGLDYAMVKIALTANRRHKVVGVDPSPSNLRQKDINQLIIRLKKLQQDSGFIENNEIKLGADPEFMMFYAKSARMIAASRFFRHYGRVGYDDRRIHKQHPIVEIRPRPSESPIELTKNLKSVLTSAARIVPYSNIKWVAGSQPYPGIPIGGHIHFSGIKLNNALLRALDNYLTIPIFLIENQRSAVRRRRRYGTLGDFRMKGYGGFEYRTLGSWLVSEQIAQAVLCLAKIVASHYHELNDNFLVNAAAQRAFYKGDQEYFLPFFNDLWSKICATELYRQYADEVEIIHEMIKNGDYWPEAQDLRRTWKLKGPFKQIYHG